MSLATARLAVADALTAAGIARVVSDPRDVNPPCVLVGLPNRLERAACGWAGELTVHVIGAGPGNNDTVTGLLDTVEAVGAVIAARTANAAPYQPDPGAPATLPAYALTVTVTT